MAWQYRAARPVDLPGVYALLAAAGTFAGADTPRAVELRLWGVWKETGWSPLNQVVAVDGDQVCGALCFFPMGERGVALEPPTFLPGAGCDPAVFVREALGVLSPNFAYAQALLEAECPAFSGGGLPVAARLLSLERKAQPEDAGIHPEVRLDYRHGDDLESVLARTLEGSRDIPVVQEALPASEMLAAYRPKGASIPRRWYVAEAGGTALGCLLLDEQGETLELKYMGVVPEERGKGLGRALLRRAIEEATQSRFSRITVTVDGANTAAKAIYFEHGFVLESRKVLHFGRF